MACSTAPQSRRGSGGAEARFRRAVTLALATLFLASCAGPSAEHGARWTVMGTYAAARVYTADAAAAEQVLGAVRSTFEAADATLSNWRETSELSRVNREAARPAGAAGVAPELASCLETALEVARETAGAFDPTVGPLMRLYGFRPRAPRLPSAEEVQEASRSVGYDRVLFDAGARSVRFLEPGMELDLGGIGKGCALDGAAVQLERLRAGAVLLDLGGNLLVRGLPPGERAWRVGIRGPGPKGELVGVVELTSGSVSTSGDYENFFEASGRRIGHIMDPRTGRPAATDVVFATVIAPRGALADALSTALLVAGAARAGEILDRFRGVEAVLLVGGEGGALRVLASGSLAGRLALEPAFLARLGGPPTFELPPRRANRARPDLL